ncbi:MAG: DUF3800 domain-containing protein [Candidatus Lambdaproteobacteria bacterium]|nr:DUF3800 domain-containing protein [Candidatus Lambdaproteobacteria bacterium]
MHLLYADDSGTTTDASQRHFVLAGVSIFERQGHWLAEELRKIVAPFRPDDPDSVELHGSPMLNGRGLWRGFPLPERISAIKNALTFLARSHPSNRVFAAAIRKASVSPDDAVRIAFEQLSSRFDMYLMRLHRKGDTQRALIIFDKSAHELLIQGLARDFCSSGHTWGKLRNLVDVPVFLDSRASRLLQLADLIAYAVFRRYETNDRQFFDIIEHRFDSEGGIIHGLYHLG